MKSRYRNLIAWRKSIQLVKDIYFLTRRFPAEELYALTTQMRRAAVSVPSNIAESQGRFTRKDCLRFLLNARGSIFEVETQLIIATELEYVAASTVNELMKSIAEIERLVNGLIRFNTGVLAATSRQR